MINDKIWQDIKETGSIGKRSVTVLDNTESTNHYAAALAKDGASSGTVVVAETQSKGRGRLGRVWLSPPGTGLYFSLIWHSQLQPEDLAKLTLAAGLGLCLALESCTNLQFKIKWPNDLFLDNKKIGGILTENLGQKQKHTLVIIGIGLNVNTPATAFPDDLAQKASSLYIFSKKKFCRGRLLTEILQKLDDTLTDLEQGQFNKILTEWRRRDATINKKMTWLTPSRKVVTGISLGINDEGLLHIRDNAGKIHEVMSGDLSLT